MHTILSEVKWHFTIVATYVRNRRQYRAVANPYAVLRIDPERVKEKVRGGMRDWGVPGTVFDGDWDLRVTPITATDKYISITRRMEEGLAWEQTQLFRSTFPHRLEKRGHVQGMTSMEELLSHYYDNVDRLCETISESGINAPSVLRRVSPLYVHIGRHGQMLWGVGGNHRLAIAKALRLKDIPVRVHVRHRYWQQWRDTVFNMENHDVRSRVRPHPDLIDVHPEMRKILRAAHPCTQCGLGGTDD